MNIHLFAHSSLWIINVVYFIAIWFQIYCNYKRQSVKGLSDLMLFGYLAAYVAQTFFIFTTDFPISAQFMVPLSMWAVVMMVVQRFMYSFGKGYIQTFVGSYMVFLTIVVCCVPLAYHYPDQVNYYSGWAATFLWALFPIPQMIKMYQTKSTEGFSFSFVLIMTLGGVFEFISSIILRLPLPMMITIVRSFLCNLIFCIQFYLYNKPQKKYKA